MKSLIQRYQRVWAILGVAILLASSQVASAADWPDHPVSVIVPYAAGGNTDTMARLLAARLTDTLGQPFIVNNDGGAAGAIGTSRVVRAQPDGYTLLFASGSQIILLPLLKKASYDPEKSLIPISVFGTGPYILGVRSSLPVKTLEELIAYGKQNPGKLTYATAGVGGISHLMAALFAATAKIEMTSVAYKGGAPAATAVAAGEVDMYFGAAADLETFSQDGRIKLLGVTSKAREAAFPSVPTIAELFPGFVLYSWNGLFAPAGTPDNVIARLAQEVKAAAQDQQTADRLKKVGIEPEGNSPAEFKKTIDSDRALYVTALKAAALQPTE